MLLVQHIVTTHVGAVVLVGGLFSSEIGAERSICSCRKLAVAGVPSNGIGTAELVSAAPS
jgi:hypothetical protein